MKDEYFKALLKSVPYIAVFSFPITFVVAFGLLWNPDFYFCVRCFYPVQSICEYLCVGVVCVPVGNRIAQFLQQGDSWFFLVSVSGSSKVVSHPSCLLVKPHFDRHFVSFSIIGHYH